MPVNDTDLEWIPPSSGMPVDFEVEDALSQLLKTLEKKNIKLNKDKSSYKWVLSEKGVQYAKIDNS